MNRGEWQECVFIEKQLSVVTLSHLQQAKLWLLKVQRLAIQDRYDEIETELHDFFKFCEKYGFNDLKYEGELFYCKLLNKLGQTADAML